MHPSLSRARRFLDEARVVVHLSHANICPVFDAGQVGAEYFMSMEYIAGLNLRDLLARLSREQAPVPPAVALQIACEVLRALGYAHKRTHPVTAAPLRLVHRDVSPHNVMIGLQGAVKLIDFGLAESTLKEEHTESHVVLGKLAYMAPEQARGATLDARCDQFAASVLLYEMLSGERYYGEMSQPEIWQVAGTGTFRPRRWNELDRELRRILGRGLAAEPSRRYPTCDELRADLDTYRYARGLVARRDDVQDLLRRCAGDRLEWEKQMRAACAPLRAPEANDPAAPGGEVTLILWRDEATGSVAVRDDSGQLARVPLLPAADTEVMPRGPTAAPPPRRRRVPAAIAASVVVVAAAAAGALLAFGGGTSGGPSSKDDVAVEVVAPPAPAVAVATTTPAVEPPTVDDTPSPPEPQEEAPAVETPPAPEVRAEPPRRRPAPRRARSRDGNEAAPLAPTTPASAPTTPAPAPTTTTEEAAAPPAPKEAAPKRKLSLAESVRVLEGCQNRCADDARALAKALDEASFKGAKRGVIDFCVQRCRAE